MNFSVTVFILSSIFNEKFTRLNLLIHWFQSLCIFIKKSKNKIYLKSPINICLIIRILKSNLCKDEWLFQHLFLRSHSLHLLLLSIHVPFQGIRMSQFCHFRISPLKYSQLHRLVLCLRDHFQQGKSMLVTWFIELICWHLLRKNFQGQEMDAYLRLR